MVWYKYFEKESGQKVVLMLEFSTQQFRQTDFWRLLCGKQLFVNIFINKLVISNSIAYPCLSKEKSLCGALYYYNWKCCFAQ